MPAKRPKRPPSAQQAPAKPPSSDRLPRPRFAKVFMGKRFFNVPSFPKKRPLVNAGLICKCGAPRIHKHARKVTILTAEELEKAWNSLWTSYGVELYYSDEEFGMKHSNDPSTLRLDEDVTCICHSGVMQLLGLTEEQQDHWEYKTILCNRFNIYDTVIGTESDFSVPFSPHGFYERFGCPSHETIQQFYYLKEYAPDELEAQMSWKLVLKFLSQFNESELKDWLISDI